MANESESTQNSGVKKAKNELVEQVLGRVNDYTNNGNFVLPKDYAVENALRAAYFIIGETIDRDKKPALDVCTPASVGEALFRMVMQGLDPVKSQCYFIVNGNKLSMRRSYLGAIAVGKRVAEVKDCPAVVVHEGDEFEFEVVNGRKKVTHHKQTLESLDKPIAGAYAICEFTTDREEYVDIMTIKEIRESWKMSQNQNNNKLQSQFGPEAAKRTIINRTMKPVINTSSDANLYQKDLKEDNEIEETTHEVLESNTKIGEKKIVSLPVATVKQTVPIETKKAEPVKVNTKEAEKEEVATLLAEESQEEEQSDDDDPESWK